MMAAIAKFRDDVAGNITTGGTSTAYTVTSNQVITANTNGFQVAFVPHTDCGASPTLAVDGQTAKPLRPYRGTDFAAGQLKQGGIYAATYNTSTAEWIVEGFSYAPQPLDSTLTALAALSTAANQIILATGTDTFSMQSFTAQAQALCAKTNYPAMKGLMDLSQSVTASSSSLSIDMSLGWNVALTLSATVSSFSVSNWPSAGTLGKLTLDITASGSYNITGWPGTTRWSAGAAPTVTSSGKDTIILTSSDGGSTFRGFIAAQALA